MNGLARRCRPRNFPRVRIWHHLSRDLPALWPFLYDPSAYLAQHGDYIVLITLQEPDCV